MAPTCWSLIRLTLSTPHVYGSRRSSLQPLHHVHVDIDCVVVVFAPGCVEPMVIPGMAHALPIAMVLGSTAAFGSPTGSMVRASPMCGTLPILAHRGAGSRQCCAPASSSSDCRGPRPTSSSLSNQGAMWTPHAKHLWAEDLAAYASGPLPLQA